MSKKVATALGVQKCAAKSPVDLSTSTVLRFAFGSTQLELSATVGPLHHGKH
eukprot:SAG31_NODE_1152_length_9642_cov_4.124489_8_plen_52_part_00